jgi:hypothetical protein
MDAVDLGDARLDKRAVSLLSTLGNRPQLSIPAACKGRAELKAAYGIFDHEKVTFDKVLQPPIERTRQWTARARVKTQPRSGDRRKRVSFRFLVLRHSC